MKKSVGFLFIAIIAIFTISCNTEQNVKSHLEISNLKGKVRKIGKTVHDADMQVGCACSIKNECNQTEYVYDPKGNLLVSYTVDVDGSVVDSSNYIYNRRGLCSEVARFNGKKSAGKEVAVLKGGRVTGYKILNEDGIVETTIKYIYSGDEISEEQTFNSNGELVSSVLNEYLNGQLVSQSEKDSNGNVRSIRKFQRNASNDIIEYLFLTTKDNTEYKFTYEYEYDSEGNWIKQTRLYNGQIENIVVRNIEYFKV